MGSKNIFKFSERVNVSELRRSRDNNNILVFDVEVMDTSKVTANRTFYPTAVVKAGIDNSLAVQRKLQNAFWCEANHPITSDDEQGMKRWNTVDMNTATHVINRLYWIGPKLMATMETTLINPALYYAILQGKNIVFSLRATGDKKKRVDGVIEAVTFNFISFDWVDVQSNENSVIIADSIHLKKDEVKYRPIKPEHKLALAESFGGDVEYNNLITTESGTVIGMSYIPVKEVSKKDAIINSMFAGL